MVNVKFPLPEVTVAEAEQIARDHFGLVAAAKELAGERDRNFHLICEDNSQYVLKIANELEELSHLELQNAVLEHLRENAAGLQLPRVSRNTKGEGIFSLHSRTGTQHFVRLLSYIPAQLFAKVKPHSRELLFSLGRALGLLDGGLQNFASPAARRELKWDPAGALWIREFLDYLPDPKRAIVKEFLQHFEDSVLPVLSSLRRAVIYNDANDYNILVHEQEVVGFIDFGDVIESAAVCDLAVAIAYAMLGMPDPLSAAVSVVEGFHSVFPLQEDELGVLFPLAVARLCITVTNAAYQRIVEPTNSYLTISEEAAWLLLDKLSKVSPALAHARFRFACGLSASRYSQSAMQWLREHSVGAHAIVDLPLQQSRILDLSVGSTEAGGFENMWNYMSVERGEAAIGRYNEARILSPEATGRIEGNEGPEWRTVHLGIDIFVPPESAVYAPLDARIHSFKNNSSRFDYGPTIILEHQTPQGIPFYTLYGHLSLDSLTGLQENQRISKGERIGSVGDSNVNGGWPPHLHFQIITDLLEMKGDFPGNASPEQRAFWLDLCPDPSLLLRDVVTPFTAPEAAAPAELLPLRRLFISDALSMSYDKPLHIVRGYKQCLYDQNGRAYLDCVNNVAHVGHCHPRVVEAAKSQMAILNTNTRYLHEKILHYAEKLSEKFPEPLRVCFFVNSGSEANELALRLARAHTNAKDLIVLEGGYHGNTVSLVDISHYKFAGPGGGGAPEWVHVAALPDLYRGKFRRNDPDAAAKYAADVLQQIGKIKSSGRRLCGFLAESMPGVAGQILLPQNYLLQVYKMIHAAGGVCIADEVQTGFGRPGSHFSAFETQNVIPDIVTLGKPIGNGHPLGAVLTTREIANSFANGMEYFNTFGGNPVSCTIGLAVLEVLKEEDLQQNAADVGSYLLKELAALQLKHPLIGDVRGSGLYIGLELVKDSSSLEPAPDEASYIVNRLRDRAILLSTDGPFHNVLKIKPPMVFTKADADLLCSQLNEILEEL